MGSPEITEQVRDVPVRALRAVFAGVGRLLLVADRLRNETAEARPGNQAADDQPDPLSARTSAAAAARASRRSRGAKPAERGKWRSLDETGNVRILSDEDFPEDQETEILAENGPSAQSPLADVPSARAAMTTAAPVAPAAPRAPRSPKRAASSRATTATVNQEAAVPDARKSGAAPATPAGLPGLPGYDELSLASLRARLRGLDLGDVRAALSYELAHAKRPEVITMFERRIEKLSGAA